MNDDDGPLTAELHRDALVRIRRFDGEILGTETIWTEEGAYEYEPGPSAGVLRSLGADGRGRYVEIGAIEVKDLPGPNHRVDVSSRRVVERSETTIQKGLSSFIPAKP